MTTGDRLREAAARVRAGWRQFVLRDFFGHVCALGALGIREPGIMSQCAATTPEIDALVRAIGVPVHGLGPVFAGSNALLIAAWNDAPQQTAANVSATLELAAIIADEEAQGKQRAVQAAREGWPI